MAFQSSLLFSVYTEGVLSSGSFGSLMNSKATSVVITSQKNSFSKTWWDMAKASSRQWINSTFGEQLFRDTIIKICCSNSEAWFKVLVNAQYSFLSTKRCPFTLLHAYSVHTLLRGMCAVFISAGILICSVTSLGHTISKILLWPVAIPPLYEVFAESIRRGQYIAHTSSKRPGQATTGQPHIPGVVGNVEFGACGASNILQKIHIFLG